LLKILFFGQVRERLDCAELDIEWADTANDLDSLQEKLCLENGPKWRAVLQQNNLIRAINQSVAHANCTLSDGDEVAFFPPVTGG
jgi:molybdopterin synthase sulfur carrier subunit